MADKCTYLGVGKRFNEICSHNEGLQDAQMKSLWHLVQTFLCCGNYVPITRQKEGHVCFTWQHY